MIISLKIEKFIDLKDIYIEFDKGLNVISGESGVGKSMLISAIKFVFGNFDKLNEDAFCEVGVFIDNEEIFISKAFKNSKSRYYINGMQSTQKVVLDLISNIVSFKEQHYQTKILRKDEQFNILDSAQEIKKIKQELSKKYFSLKDIKEKIKELSYRKLEIESSIKEKESIFLDLELIPIKDIDFIKEKLSYYSDANKINEIIDKISFVLKHDSSSVISKINLIKDMSSKLNLSEDEIGLLIEALDKLNIFYDTILQKKYHIDLEEFEELNKLMFDIQRLERKYKKDFKSLILEKDKIESLKLELSQINSEIEKLYKTQKDLEIEFYDIATKLSEKRLLEKENIERYVNSLLEELGITKKFLIEIRKKDEITQNGFDEIEFLFSFKGKSFPISEIASGGELTRLSLALSTFSPIYKTFIFDEIDAGLSGESSIRLSKILKALSKNVQVIAITHTPALAAAANNHVIVKREHLDDNIIVRVKTLVGNERLYEISRLMGVVSSDTLKGASKLMEILN